MTCLTGPLREEPVHRPAGGGQAPSRVRALILLAVACFGLLGVLYLAAAHTGIGQRIDDDAVRGRARNEGVQHAARGALHTVSVTSLSLVGAAAVFVALRRRRPRLAVGVAFAVVGANVTTQVLKATLTRPDLSGRGGAGTSTFPSGHATVAMSLAVALMLVAPRRLQPLVAVAGVAYATAVGGGTVVAGWHRPSDVLGAYLLVTAWMAVLVAWLIARRGPGRPRLRPGWLDAWPFRPGPERVGVVAAGAALVAAGLAVGAAAVASEVRLARIRQLDEVFLVALVVVAVTATAAFASLLAALRGVYLDPPPVPGGRRPARRA